VIKSKKNVALFPTCVKKTWGKIRMWIGIVLIDPDPDLDRHQSGNLDPVLGIWN